MSYIIADIFIERRATFVVYQNGGMLKYAATLAKSITYSDDENYYEELTLKDVGLIAEKHACKCQNGKCEIINERGRYKHTFVDHRLNKYDTSAILILDLKKEKAK